MQARTNWGFRHRRRSAVALNDVQTFVAALGGDAKVKAIYDTNSNVTQGAGVVTAWDDARGAAGFAPQLVSQKGAGAYPTWDSVNKLVTTDGSQNWLQTVSDAKFDQSGNTTLICIVKAAAQAYPTMYIGNASGFTQQIDLSLMSGGPAYHTAPGATTAATQPTPSAAVRLLVSSRNTETMGAGPTAANKYQYTEGFASRAYSINGASGAPFTGSYPAGAQQLALGKMLGAANMGAAAFKTVIVVDHQLTMAEHDALVAFATARGATYTANPLILCDGNSLVAGTHSTNLATKAWPARLQAANAALASYEVVNAGAAGITGTTMIGATAGGDGSASTFQKDRGLSLYHAARTRNFYLYQEYVNDSQYGASAATIEANVQAACLAAKARGFTVLVLTWIKANGYGVDADRLTVNTWLRANWATFADALVDVAANPNLSDPTNTTYFYTDQLHLIDAGYEEVANNATYGVYPALAPLL